MELWVDDLNELHYENQYLPDAQIEVGAVSISQVVSAYLETHFKGVSDAFFLVELGLTFDKKDNGADVVVALEVCELPVLADYPV